MLDPNEGNFIKIASGEIIPVDFDYMIIHDNSPFLEYQKNYLDGRMGFALKMGAETEAAIKYVLSSYPDAEDYFFKQWASKKHLIQPEHINHAAKATAPPAKVMKPFILKDKMGDNFVDRVEIKDGNYIFSGRNTSNEPRSIIIDKNEKATGFKGSKDLGVVGYQMYQKRAAIFAHFEIQAPFNQHQKQDVNFANAKDTFFKGAVEVPAVKQAKPHNALFMN